MTGFEAARVAQAIFAAAKAHGLAAPMFRCPPSDPTLDRALHRRAGGVTLLVRTVGRPASAVVADIVAGVAAVNAAPSQAVVDELTAVGLDAAAVVVPARPEWRVGPKFNKIAGSRSSLVVGREPAQMEAV